VLYKKICSLSLDVKNKAERLKINYRLLSKKKHPIIWLMAGALGLIATFPFFLYGNIFNMIFLETANHQSLKIKDIQFRSSVKFGISFGLILVLTPVILALMLILIPTWWIPFLVFFSLPLAGMIAWIFYLLFLRVKGGFRIRNYIRNNNSEYFNLKNNYNELVSLVATL
jgi:hypothetical protein